MNMFHDREMTSSNWYALEMVYLVRDTMMLIMARSNGESRLSKLQGLQPQVQEFHKRMLHMQVILAHCYLINNANTH